MMDDQERQTAVVTSNVENVSFTALQIRLETDRLLEKLEIFLRGAYTITVQDEMGNPIIKTVKSGTPKANEEGIQSIMAYVSTIINPHTVQGNFDRDLYDDYIYEVNTYLACNIVNNCTKWGIQENNIRVVLDYIVFLIIPFMSRLIDNEERKSYTGTIKHMDSISGKEKKDGFKLFG